MNTVIKIETFTDSKECVSKIKEAVLRSGAVSVNVYQTESAYWWEDRIKEKVEFKIEILCLKKKVDELVKLIKENHNYKLPAIMFLEVNIPDGYEDLKSWLEKYS